MSQGGTPQVLVLGAGGFLGLNIVHALLARGVTPRCGRRPRGNVLALRGLGVPLVVTDLDAPATLTEAFAGVDVLVHAAAHYPKLSLDREASLKRGLAELDVVLEAARKAGVRRLVFLSSTATVAPRADGPSTEADVFSACPDFGTYHALKWHLEARVADCGLDAVVLCPAACLGPWDWKVGTSSLLLATVRGAPPPHPRGRITTVDSRDVGEAVVAACLLPSPPRRVLLGGEAFDAHELFELLARRYGAPAPPPALEPEAARRLADELEREALATGKRPALARELVDLIVHAPAIDASAAHVLGVSYRPFSDTLDAWDAWARRMGFFPAPRVEHSA